MEPDTEARVREVLVEELGLDEAEVTLDATLVEDLGADSLDCVELAMALEEEFGLDEIPTDAWDDLTTVRSLIDYIDRRTTALPSERAAAR